MFCRKNDFHNSIVCFLNLEREESDAFWNTLVQNLHYIPFRIFQVLKVSIRMSVNGIRESVLFKYIVGDQPLLTSLIWSGEKSVRPLLRFYTSGH